jgi:hypothetical protein
MPIHLPRLELSKSLTFCALSQSVRQSAAALEFFHTQLQHASRIALEQKATRAAATLAGGAFGGAPAFLR